MWQPDAGLYARPKTEATPEESFNMAEAHALLAINDNSYFHFTVVRHPVRPSYRAHHYNFISFKSQCRM